MAWGVKKVKDERKKFCQFVLKKELSIAEACRCFNITRKTGYKWLERFETEGDDGLVNRTTAPHNQNQATPTNIISEILKVKARYPSFGPKKILPKLKEMEPSIKWPGTTTIGEILKRNGLTKTRKIRRRLAARPTGLNESNKSNDIWCMDFKGWSITKDKHKFEPFTLTDHFSRFLLKCLKLDINDTDHVWSVLDIAFREYGLPLILRSDNGPPFATTAPGRLSKLSIKLIKAGVIPEWIEPGKPQQNGRHERMHGTLKEIINLELNLEEQTNLLQEFQQFYNFERPHEALGQQTPGIVYAPSLRIWNGILKPMEYAKGYKVARVKGCGKMSWRHRQIYVSRVFSNELLGIREEDDELCVYFGQIFLGKITDESALEVTRREVRKRYKK